MLDDQLRPATPTPLVRSLGVGGVLFLTLSVATPASSVFVIVPGMFQVAGTGAVWAMILAGLVCVATAFVYAELSSAWPIAGGEYVAVAHTLGPLAGFVMLGVNVFNNLLFPPVAGLGVAAVLGVIVPRLPTVPIAIGVVVASTLVALLHIRVNAWVTGLFLAVEVVALAVIVSLGFGHIARPVATFLTHPVMPSAGHLVPASAASIGLATSIAIFALNGYGAAVYFGEEMLDAPRRIARAILAALALTLLLGIAPTVAALAGAPDLHALVTADDPFGLLASMRGGDALAGAIAIGVVIAIANAVIACILASARFFYSTGCDRAWGRPVDRWLATVHPRLGSPWIGTLIVGGVGVACCFLPLTLLLVVSGTGLIAIYGGIALAALAGRRSGTTAHAPYRMPLFPLAPVVTLLALAYIVWTSWLDPTEGRPGLIMTAAQIAGSADLLLARRPPPGRLDRADPGLDRHAASKRPLASMTRSLPSAIAKTAPWMVSVPASTRSLTKGKVIRFAIDTFTPSCSSARCPSSPVPWSATTRSRASSSNAIQSATNPPSPGAASARLRVSDALTPPHAPWPSTRMSSIPSFVTANSTAADTP